MQDSECQPAERVRNESRLTILVRHVYGLRASMGIACLLLAWDVAFTGSFLMSFLVCPIWFLGSIVKSAVERPGWGLAISRIVAPALTFGLVLANNAVQLRVGETNAPRVVAACEEFRAAKGRFPKTLDELVPRYLPSIPRAKYCLNYGEFVYWNNQDHPLLVWHVVPPFGRRIYNFEERRWNYID